MTFEKPTADQVKAAREAAGLTQAACAELFGYALRTWQGKEDAGAGNRGITIGEYAYLLLMAAGAARQLPSFRRLTEKYEERSTISSLDSCDPVCF